MVLFRVELGRSGTIQEHNAIGVDSISPDYFANRMEMYKMYDRTYQALEAIAEVLNQMHEVRSKKFCLPRQFDLLLWYVDG